LNGDVCDDGEEEQDEDGGEDAAWVRSMKEESRSDEARWTRGKTWWKGARYAQLQNG
jgi:hypothetical protein